MENTDLFPNMVIQMIAVGEESGSLDEMSAKVADFYEEDVDNAVDNLSSLLEPMIMAILGVSWSAVSCRDVPADLQDGFRHLDWSARKRSAHKLNNEAAFGGHSERRFRKGEANQWSSMQAAFTQSPLPLRLVVIPVAALLIGSFLNVVIYIACRS